MRAGCVEARRVKKKHRERRHKIFVINTLKRLRAFVSLCQFHCRLILPLFLSVRYQHGVAVGSEAVAFFQGDVVGVHHLFVSAERCHNHQ